MNNLIQIATADLSAFLNAQLPLLSKDWWENNVINELSFQQKLAAENKGLTKLEQLDFASLLRVLDHNWHNLQQQNNFPWEGRTWVKELRSVRNKWAHLSSQGISQKEIYRDADTLGRVLELLGAPRASLAVIENFQTNTLNQMVNSPEADATYPKQVAGPKVSAGHSTPVNTQTFDGAQNMHICDQLVIKAKYLEQKGFTQRQLSSLHHFSLQGKEESFSATYEYFGVRRQVLMRNRNYANRIIFVAKEYENNSGSFSQLIPQALEKWPLR